jgi:hypothetical protein
MSGVSIIEAMVIDMNEAQVRTPEQVVVQRAVRSQLGGRLEHARHQHGLQQRLQIRRGQAEAW